MRSHFVWEINVFFKMPKIWPIANMPKIFSSQNRSIDKGCNDNFGVKVYIFGVDVSSELGFKC